MLDGIGCALIGAQLPWSQTAVEAVLAFEGAGDHPVIGWDRSTSAPAAALLNGTFIQGFELDDFHPFAPLHSASLIVPALLAAAPLTEGIDGAAMVRAAVVGFEVGPRVGLALHGSEMLTRGWHSGSVFGPIAELRWETCWVSMSTRWRMPSASVPPRLAGSWPPSSGP